MRYVKAILLYLTGVIIPTLVIGFIRWDWLWFVEPIDHRVAFIAIAILVLIVHIYYWAATDKLYPGDKG